MAVKKFSLRFIQIAWVTEIAAMIIYSFFVVPFFPIDRAELWYKLLPALGSMIVAQGGAGSIGPLVADKIRKEKEIV